MTKKFITTQLFTLAYILFLFQGISFGISTASLLETIGEKWDPIEEYEATFRQVTEQKGEEKTIEYIGKVYLQRPNQIRVNFFLSSEVPNMATEEINSATPHQWYYADGKTLWFYDREARTVHKDWLSAETLPFFITILAAAENFDYKTFQERFFIKPIVEEKVLEKDSYLMRVRGKGDVKKEGEWDLYLDKKTHLPLKNVSRLPGVIYTVEIFEQKTNKPIPKGVFSPKVSSDTILVDHTLEY